MNKVILISIDGMRPDGLLKCGHPYVETLLKNSTHTLNGRSVVPSVTLPCHMSIFLSVPPERHGITTNLYMPTVRPVNGIMEQVKAADKKASMYYGWEPIRDISRPGSLAHARFIKARAEDKTDRCLTETALSDIRAFSPDFVFLYMVETDEKGGHDHGWMSDAYLACIYEAIDNVKNVVDAVGDTYNIIITADHGGHDRSHGTELSEDMTVPMFFMGDSFPKGKELETASIMDIAPTVAALMGISPAREWEGKSII